MGIDRQAPAPLFRDPIYDGAADPTIIYNREEKAWYMLYTSRRANVDCRHMAWAHGTEIGVASSSDGGAFWNYRGTVNGIEFEPGKNTFWAPEVMWHDGTYHMYCTYVKGIPHVWAGGRWIVHYISENLWDWTYQSTLTLSSERVIDASVEKMPNGVWRMWYKDEADESHTYAADSTDLYSWAVVGPVITDCHHEGPNVFHWKGYYWMITDPWEGLGVYRSEDGEFWTRLENILREPGTRVEDGWKGQHADVLISGDKAYIIYFVHPAGAFDEAECEMPEILPYEYRRSVIQVAELDFEDGRISCDRNREVVMCLGEDDNWDHITKRCTATR